MRKPIQSQPVRATSTFNSSAAAISPSDCPDGNLFVAFPDGSSVNVPGAVPCCYSYPSCGTCDRSPSYWNNWIGTHFYNQCGENNANNCYYRATC